MEEVAVFTLFDFLLATDPYQFLFLRGREAATTMFFLTCFSEGWKEPSSTLAKIIINKFL